MQEKSLKVGDYFTDCYGGEFQVSSIYVEDGVAIAAFASDDNDYTRPLNELLPMLVEIGNQKFEKQRNVYVLLPSGSKHTKRQENELIRHFEATAVRWVPEEGQRLWNQPIEGREYPWDHLEPIKTWLSKHSAVRDILWVEGDLGVVVDMLQWAAAHERQAVHSIKNTEGKHTHFRYYPY
jgi:hypothetical protein